MPEAPAVTAAPPALAAPVDSGSPAAFESHGSYETPAVFEALANFEAAMRAPDPTAPVEAKGAPPADPFFASAFGTPAAANRFEHEPDGEIATGPRDLGAAQADEAVVQAPPATASASSFEVGGEIAFRAQTSPEEDFDAGARAADGGYKEAGYLPDWAGDISEPSWEDNDAELDASTAQATDAPAAPRAVPTTAPFDWAAPESAAPTPAKPSGSNGDTAGGPHAVPAPDHVWDPMMAKDTSKPFDDEPLSAPSPTGSAPAKPSWASSIDHGVSIASARSNPEHGAWDPAPPTKPLSGTASRDINPTGFTPTSSPEVNPASFAPTSPVELIPATFAPKAPDLGIASTLVTGPSTDTRAQPTAPAQPLAGASAEAPNVAATPAPPSAAPSWDTVPPREAVPNASNAVGPAEQARNTADGLRRLTRRVPGASLPQEDGSLRRPTPTSTAHNPLGLTGALSQYLSATANEGRPEKEHNAR